MIVLFVYEIKNIGVCFDVSSIVLKEVVKMDNLLKMKKRFYMLVLMILPLTLMFLLHMCIAIGNYLNISININNVFAKDWFMFYASYLGGCMTLVGVIFSMSNERKLSQFQIGMEAIEKEKMKLASLINQINVFLPVTILQHFLGLAILKDGYDAKEIAIIRRMIIDELNNIFIAKREMLLLTSIYIPFADVYDSKQQGDLLTMQHQFQKRYELVVDDIYKCLQSIDTYINIENNNMRYKCMIILCKERDDLANRVGEKCKDERVMYESKIVNTTEMINEITSAARKIMLYNEKEIWELTNLSINYTKYKSEILRKRLKNEV